MIKKLLCFTVGLFICSLALAQEMKTNSVKVIDREEAIEIAKKEVSGWENTDIKAIAKPGNYNKFGSMVLDKSRKLTEESNGYWEVTFIPKESHMGGYAVRVDSKTGDYLTLGLK
jgi:hypothetical protein